MLEAWGLVLEPRMLVLESFGGPRIDLWRLWRTMVDPLGGLGTSFWRLCGAIERKITDLGEFQKMLEKT